MSENEEKSLDPLLALSSELPELPACWTFQHPERLYTADQMRAYATEATNYYGHLLRAANARGEWLPIESAPKDGSLFLCWVSATRYSSSDGECSSYDHDVSDFDFAQWRTHSETPGEGYFMNMMGQIGDTQDITHWQKLTPPALGSEAKS